jgi:acetyl esterase/lipase
MTLTDPEALKAWKPTDLVQPLHNAIPPELLPRFDPVYVEYYNKNNLGRLHTHEIPIEEFRKNPDKYSTAYGRAPGPDIYRITEQKCPVDGGEITVRIFEPEPVKNADGTFKQRGAYINFHGGGWVFGDLTKDHDFCKLMVHALEGDLVAFDVDYRLAPEYKYPIPVDDCWAAFNWVSAVTVPSCPDINKSTLRSAHRRPRSSISTPNGSLSEASLQVAISPPSLGSYAVTTTSR